MAEAHRPDGCAILNSPHGHTVGCFQAAASSDTISIRDPDREIQVNISYSWSPRNTRRCHCFLNLLAIARICLKQAISPKHPLSKKNLPHRLPPKVEHRSKLLKLLLGKQLTAFSLPRLTAVTVYAHIGDTRLPYVASRIG